MNTKTPVLACAIAAGLLGCTTPPLPDPPIPPPEIAFDLPLEPAPKRLLFKGDACLVSTAQSCMAMDSRPFEPCLVSAKTCDRNGAEVMKVAPPLVFNHAVESR